MAKGKNNKGRPKAQMNVPISTTPSPAPPATTTTAKPQPAAAPAKPTVPPGAAPPNPTSNLHSHSHSHPHPHPPHPYQAPHSLSHALDFPPYEPLTFLDEYVRSAAFIPSRIGDKNELVYLTQREVALAKLDILGRHIIEKMPDFEENTKRGHLSQDQLNKFKEMEKAYRAKLAATEREALLLAASLPKDKGKGKSTTPLSPPSTNPNSNPNPNSNSNSNHSSSPYPLPSYGVPTPGWSPAENQLSHLSAYQIPDLPALARLIAFSIKPPEDWKDREEASVESSNYRPYAYSADNVALSIVKKMPDYVRMVKNGLIPQAQLDQLKAIAREHAIKVVNRHAQIRAAAAAGLSIDEATQQLASLALDEDEGGKRGKRKGGK